MEIQILNHANVYDWTFMTISFFIGVKIYKDNLSVQRESLYTIAEKLYNIAITRQTKHSKETQRMQNNWASGCQCTFTST